MYTDSSTSSSIWLRLFHLMQYYFDKSLFIFHHNIFQNILYVIIVVTIFQINFMWLNITILQFRYNCLKMSIFIWILPFWVVVTRRAHKLEFRSNKTCSHSCERIFFRFLSKHSSLSLAFPYANADIFNYLLLIRVES